MLTASKREFIERLREGQEEQNDWCRTCVSTWTENIILEGSTPSVERFMIENEEWDYDHYIDIVEAEINRVSALCAKEEIGA